MARLLGPVAWEWPGWLAAGLMTLLVGDSGSGKSGLAMRIAATYLAGWPWPDGTLRHGEPSSVLWIEAEAAQAVNLERAQSWKLQIERILTPFKNPLDDAGALNPLHLDTNRASGATSGCGFYLPRFSRWRDRRQNQGR